MKKKKSGGGANWMDTYGDMVTLLLCFFVLLYSISTIDQQKWAKIVQSFNPDAIATMTESSGDKGAIADPVENPDQGDTLSQEQIDQAMEELYQKIMEYASTEGVQENISVTKGDGSIFISFNDAIFFDGDSYVLRQEGCAVLDKVAQLLSNTKKAIDEVQVLGHTAQGTAGSPNNSKIDRFLSSNRATVVLVYLQEHATLNPARLVSLGYGQWRPVSGNGSSAERAKNRRVELVISGYDVQNQLGDSITRYYTERNGALQNSAP